MESSVSSSQEIQANDGPSSIVQMKNPSNFNRMPECCGPLPVLTSTENHTVLFKPNIVPGKAPEEFPETFEDKWDDDHVHMPCSSCNRITLTHKNGKQEQVNAWEVIKDALSKPITSVQELQEAVSKYSKPYGYNDNMNRLEAVLDKEFSKEEKKQFFTCTLPKIINLALELPLICTQPIPLLKIGKNHSITMSQKQIACLLANAFLSTFPRCQDFMRSRKIRGAYNSIKFAFLSSMQDFSPSRDRKPMEKIKCLLNYFQRITTKEPTGTVTFQRRCLTQLPDWSSSNSSLSGLWLREKGTIENEGADMTQVDFADEYIGGLVLKSACAQEELLFILSPELIASMFFTQKLTDKETLLVTGYERYNSYSGYEHTFQWEGNFCDETSRDAWGRKYKQLIAMDALHMSRLNEFQESTIERELNKAFCGFNEPNLPPETLPAIASGKWGCGVFKGTPQLKSLIQLMAASEAKRDLVLFTFNDLKLKEEVESLYCVLISKNITVGKLWGLLKKYYEDIVLKDDGTAVMLTLYEFLYREIL